MLRRTINFPLAGAARTRYGRLRVIRSKVGLLRYFHAVDHSVFSPIKRSLRLSPVAGA